MYVLRVVHAPGASRRMACRPIQIRSRQMRASFQRRPGPCARSPHPPRPRSCPRQRYTILGSVPEGRTMIGAACQAVFQHIRGGQAGAAGVVVHQAKADGFQHLVGHLQGDLAAVGAIHLVAVVPCGWRYANPGAGGPAGPQPGVQRRMLAARRPPRQQLGGGCRGWPARPGVLGRPGPGWRGGAAPSPQPARPGHGRRCIRRSPAHRYRFQPHIVEQHIENGPRWWSRR